MTFSSPIMMSSRKVNSQPILFSNRLNPMASPFNLILWLAHLTYLAPEMRGVINPQVNCFIPNKNRKHSKERTSVRYDSYSKNIYSNNNNTRSHISKSRSTSNEPYNMTHQSAVACVHCTPVGAAPNIPQNTDTQVYRINHILQVSMLFLMI